jgi:uncharacterized protein (DUF1697 family)
MEDCAAGMSGSRPLVALLRGINVGGRNSIPMAGLRSALEELGLEDVMTYIQSGNVLFRSRTPVRTLPARIEEAIADAYGVRPAVVLRTPAELQRVVDSTPFTDSAKAHVVFLDRKPTAAAAARLDPDRSPGDVFDLVGRELYLHLGNGAGRTKLTGDYLERTLGVRGTQRNWNTVVKLLALAREL